MNIDLSSLQHIEMGYCALGGRERESSSLTMRSNEIELNSESQISLLLPLL